MYIETKHCIIRRFEEEDKEALYEVLSDAEVMKYIEPPFTLLQTEAFIKEAGMGERPLVYALEYKENIRVIGHVIFHAYEEKCFEIGWIINKQYWGKGIASEVTAALITYLKCLGVDSCVMECDPNQKVTRHIALKYGFVYKGLTDEREVYRLYLST